MIEIRTIEDIALLRESEELECKKAAGRDGAGELPKDFWPSYSAMANTDGGMVLLGVQEKNGKFELHGIEKPDRIRKDLADLLQNREKVSVNLLSDNVIQDIEIGGKTILQITIPRATRQQKPVFLNGNPLKGNSYRRFHEADQAMSDEEVKRLLAEQTQDSLDDRVLHHFGIEDLDAESLRIYRQTHANLNPGHVWTGQTDLEFLRSIGAWGKIRETSETGLTVGGLLMFGTFQGIQDVFPNYMLDYQERPEARTEKRWIDRVTLDGTWSGNLYDFYRKIYPKLIADLKIPFEIVDGVRQEDTPVHVALREALANTIVHADYSERASVLVVKRPDMFGFRNPGLMRIPPAIALQGHEADCRNRKLHAMFRYVNIGEQAGTGIPKILFGWESQHWRRPSLQEEQEPNNRTTLELRMLDLFPPGIIDILRLQFKDKFDELPQLERLALATTLSERRLTHARLSQLCSEHAADVSKTLHRLVRDGFLTISGSGKGAIYRFDGTRSVSPEDVFKEGESEDHSQEFAKKPGNKHTSSGNWDPSSGNLDPSSGNLDPSSGNLDPGSGNLPPERDEQGRLRSKHYGLPFVDNLDALSPELIAELEELAAEPREKGRIPKERMKAILIALCEGHFVTLRCLAKLVNREPETLRKEYLSKMWRERGLRLAFPDSPNDSRQAYTKGDGA